MSGNITDSQFEQIGTTADKRQKSGFDWPAFWVGAGGVVMVGAFLAVSMSNVGADRAEERDAGYLGKVVEADGFVLGKVGRDSYIYERDAKITLRIPRSAGKVGCTLAGVATELERDEAGIITEARYQLQGTVYPSVDTRIDPVTKRRERHIVDQEITIPFDNLSQLTQVLGGPDGDPCKVLATQAVFANQLTQK